MSPLQMLYDLDKVGGQTPPWDPYLYLQTREPQSPSADLLSWDGTHIGHKEVSSATPDSVQRMRMPGDVTREKLGDKLGELRSPPPSPSIIHPTIVWGHSVPGTVLRVVNKIKSEKDRESALR